MLPVLTPSEMTQVDAAAPEPVEVLVQRAGGAVARAVIDELGGAYGRRVVVVAGPGNNGWDGRVAAERLARRGVRVRTVEPGADVPSCDLVVDAAFGTGFHGTYRWAPPAGVPVLAVDIPSGVDGLTGVASGKPARACRTVTFAAWKPGLLYGEGPDLSGRVDLADIGLTVGSPSTHLVEDADVAARFPLRQASAHKWQSATWIVGGSTQMPGAPALAARAAFGGGAGYVRVGIPGLAVPPGLPLAAVGTSLPIEGWSAELVDDVGRVGSVVVGPGLGRSESVRRDVLAVVGSLPVPVVVDGDGLWALAGTGGRLADAPRVLTPHDGEFTQLTGHPPGADRIDATRRLAAERGAVVLLKGPTTTVADPHGRVLVVRSGDARLASAGTGDVLSGLIGALLARGLDPWWSAAIAAHVHGRAGSLLPRVGGGAADLPVLLGRVLADLVPGAVG